MNIKLWEVCDGCKGKYWSWKKHRFCRRHLLFVRKIAEEQGELETFNKELGYLLES